MGRLSTAASRCFVLGSQAMATARGLHAGPSPVKASEKSLPYPRARNERRERRFPWGFTYRTVFGYRVAL